MKNIVILGAGFGGLQATLRLGKFIRKLKLSDRYQITLVNREPYHTFTPLLYEIATTSETVAENAALRTLVTFELHKLLAGLPVTIVTDEVRSVNLPGRTVHLASRELPFNYLILAAGAEVNYFGIQGFSEYALPFKTFADALKIRDALSTAVAHADEGLVRVVVGGGGPTGVELAAEIATQTSQSHICPHSHNLLHRTREGATVNCSTLSETRADASATSHRVHVTIIEAGPSILAAMDPRVVRKAERRLKRLGVSILTRERIAKVFPTLVLLASGEKVHFDVCIWTGGVKPSSLAEPLPLKKELRGRIEIAPATDYLPTDRNLAAARGIYAIGDIAYLFNPRTKTPIPGMARPAIMEGRVAAANIIEEIKADEGRHSKKHEYIPRRYPYIVPVGGKFAIAKIGPFVVSGFIAWVFKGIVELNYFLSIMPVWRALTAWFKGLFTFIKNKKLG